MCSEGNASRQKVTLVEIVYLQLHALKEHKNATQELILLHSEWPKLYGDLAVLSAEGSSLVEIVYLQLHKTHPVTNKANARTAILFLS